MALTLAQLQDYINTNVKKNGRNAISGDVMNYALAETLGYIANEFQTILVAGASLKTVNGNSLLGAGDVVVQSVLISGTNIKTVGGVSLLGSGDVAISSSNISNSDLTISAAGTRKLKMYGSAATDIFAIRNSTDAFNILALRGDGILDIRNSSGSLCIGGAGTLGAAAVIISYPGGSATGGLRSVAVGGDTNGGSDGVAIGYNVKVNTAGAGGIAVGNIISGGGLSMGYTIANTGSIAIGYYLTVGGSGPTNGQMALFGRGMTENSGVANMQYTFGFGWYASGTANKAGLSFRSNNMNHLLVGYHTTDTSYSNTTGTNWIGVKNGTAPAGQVDAFQIFSKDIVAGNAAPHFICENLDEIKIYSIGGWGTPTGTLTRTTFDESTVTLPELAQRVAAMITDLKTGHQLFKA